MVVKLQRCLQLPKKAKSPQTEAFVRKEHCVPPCLAQLSLAQAAKLSTARCAA